MLTALFSWLGPYLVAGGLGLLALVATYLKGRGDGKSIATTDSLKRDVAARDEQLEMHREATAFERDMAALSDAEARKEAEPWVRH